MKPLNYGGSVMGPEHRQTDSLDNLRWLSASDPKQARTAFLVLLQQGTDAVNDILGSASGPGDGRLRQMIAMVYRTDPATSVLEPWLRRWLEAEADEFTRAAIESALASRKAPVPAARPTARSAAAQTVEAYRFVADRLCHRIRNAMTLPNAQIKRLEQMLGSIADPVVQNELMEIFAGIQAGFVRISRSVEFDTGDDYLTWQSIPLVTWLYSMEKEFTARFGQAKLSIPCEPVVRKTTVRGTRFFLETLFGNLWSNAIQASDPPCRFEVQCALDSGRGVLDMLVLDSGPGFTESHLDTAFQQVFSTKSPSRGRGLLEIADAVAKLQGTVELVKVAGSEYRIRIGLPAEAR
jgi:signal transduction histidine kinase